MSWKVMTIASIFLLIALSFALTFRVSYIKPVSLEVNYLEKMNQGMGKLDYGAVPVFAENMRFNHNLISYNIEDDCDYFRRKDMTAAFNIFTDNVKVVSFYEVDKGGDIEIGCSDDFIELGGGLFAAGEGGPSRIINTSGFKVIEEGKIILYNGMHCNYPIVALHELCHVFGFDHSSNPKNIMYNTSSCDQRMSEDMIDLMRELYSVEPLADARIDDVKGVLHGAYLDFNLSVLNEGLADINDTKLAIFVDGGELISIDLGGIEIGYGRTLDVENMRVGRNVKKIEFVVDNDNFIRELDEDNNAATLGLSAS